VHRATSGIIDAGGDSGDSGRAGRTHGSNSLPFLVLIHPWHGSGGGLGVAWGSRAARMENPGLAGFYLLSSQTRFWTNQKSQPPLSFPPFRSQFYPPPFLFFWCLSIFKNYNNVVKTILKKNVIRSSIIPQQFFTHNSKIPSHI
jgi:hypothetical protein